MLLLPPPRLALVSAILALDSFSGNCDGLLLLHEDTLIGFCGLPTLLRLSFVLRHADRTLTNGIGFPDVPVTLSICDITLAVAIASAATFI